MAHSYTNCLVHYVFSTKNRERLLSDEVRSRLWPYIGGIARQNGMNPLAVGGVEDHAHALVAVPAVLSIAKAIQLIKGGSSKWLHETFPSLRSFAWQEGYGAFTIGVSGVDDTVAYIKRQDEHHRNRTFDEEFVAFLRRHGIQYDDRYVFG
jgi:REP element-mobilizing transposase RayT